MRIVGLDSLWSLGRLARGDGGGEGLEIEGSL